MEPNTLNECNDYWSLLPTKDSDVYFEIRKYLENPGGETDIMRIFKKSTHVFLETNLIHFPYPMCQIIRCFPSTISAQLFNDALSCFAKMPLMTLIEKKWNLFNLLVNLYVTDKWIKKSEQFIFPIIKQFDENTEIFCEFLLVLLAHASTALTGAYTNYENSVFAANPFASKAAYSLAIDKKVHFFEHIFFDEFVDKIPTDILDCINLIKILIAISNGVRKTKENFDDIQCQFEEGIDPEKLSTNHRIVYNEVKRIFQLYQFIRKNKRFDYQMKLIAIRTFSQKYSIIDYLYEFDDGGIIVATSDYSKIRELMIANKEFNVEINAEVATTFTKPPEIDVYDQYYVVQLLAEVIVIDCHVKNYEEIVHVKCNEIKQIIDEIMDGQAFIKAIEALYTLIFLRWEHINGKLNSNHKLENSTSLTTLDESDTSEDENYYETAKRLQRMQSISKNGFICSFILLRSILTVLSAATIKQITLNDRSVNDPGLERISNEIANAKWRLSLFDLYYSSVNQIQMTKNLKYLLTPCYEDIPAQVASSSDEENDNRGKRTTATVARRKPRKKVPFRKQDNDKNISFAHSTEIDKKKKPLQMSDISSIQEANTHDRRTIVSKMLGPPINLVAVCMSRGDLNEARNIIHANELDHSNLAQELKYLENVNELKSQLKDYPKAIPGCATENKMDSDYSVEEIKNLVVHGFEASQILNLLEIFIAKNPVLQSRETKAILERFSVNYPYMNLYTGPALQGISVTDYLLSLGNNSDICFNICNMLPKLWDKDTRIDRLENQLGYYGCFRHILSSLSLFNLARKQTFGVQYLLSHECYLFNVNEMTLRLKQEDTFEKLKQIDVRSLASIQGLKENILIFEVFNKKDGNLLSYVFYYSINMNRLTNFKHLNIKEINCTSLQEILEIDLFSLIGQIIFDNNSMTSLNDIEAIVCNLNTNLLHVISMNTCPVISICGKFVPNPLDELTAMQQTLNKNAEHKDESNLQLLSQQKFEIKNQEILDYIRQHNELIAYLMGEIHGFKCSEQSSATELNCEILKNLLKMNELLFRRGNSEQRSAMEAALKFDCFDLTIVKELIKKRDYGAALNAILHCQENYYKKFQTQILQIQDVLIQKLLEKNNSEVNSSSAGYDAIEFISNLSLKATILLENIEHIDDHKLAMRLIRTILLHNRMNQVPDEQLKHLKRYLSDISLYANITKVLSSPTKQTVNWIEIMKISRTTPDAILNDLIELREYDLCYQWIQKHPLNAQNVIKPKFIERLLNCIAEENGHNQKVESFTKLCETLLKEMVLQMSSNLLMQLKNRQLLQYLVNFLIDQSPNENQVYRNYKISLRILEVIGEDEANTLWALIQEPLLIIEQYILNTKFEALAIILRAIRPMIYGKNCKICIENKQDNIMPTLRGSAHFYKPNLGDNNLHRNYVSYKNHCISIDCVDYLLRIYAAKALDFRISETFGQAESSSQSTEMTSLDSLCGTFLMPREAPDKSNWIRDEEASHCMCCKRSVFTMLTRRHHCRRCGRVVCHSCSTKRMHIPKLYADVMVRVCDDCSRQTEESNNATKFVKLNDGSPSVSLPSFPPTLELTHMADECGWLFRFSGHLKHDNLLREEFSFEYAPSASLCLSILSLHTSGTDCGNFLLGYCQKFETLLRPIHPGHSNPEVDYAFVTRILYCLSLAAKVHGGSPECAKIRERAEIINSVVQNGCESLLPMESLNTASLRKLRDSLVVAEKWSLATELSLKCGFPKTGIMAAWGIACLKSGCFETAREKFNHCLTRTCYDEDRHQIIELLTLDDSSVKNARKEYSFQTTMRPAKLQPLLQEIINVLETTCHPLHSDVLQKATVISQSNRSLASIKSRKKENIPIHEPAVNILHTLANLKNISQGKYTIKTHKPILNLMQTLENGNHLTFTDSDPHSRFYGECMYYLVSYGRHIDILRFLTKYKQIIKALKYTLLLQIQAEQFIQTIILPHLKIGMLNIIIEHMIEMDETIIVWKEYIIKTCLLLEKKRLFNSLYQMQLVLKDTVRASMTCVKFYTMGSSTYQELCNNGFHLINAQKHLKSELELCQWEEIKVHSKRPEENLSLVMKMDSKSLNQHINTIWRQIEAAKFLAECEENDKETVKLIPKISLLPCTRIPTLFGTAQDKIILTSLILICGSNIEEGFGLAYRIIQDLTLNSDKIYAIVTKFLSLNNRLHDVEKLIDCIKSNSNHPDNQLCDEILSLAVQTAFSVQGNQHHMKATIENLIRLIDDIGIQIDCYILSGQLKSAYLLAVQHKRVPDIKRILRNADKTNQLQIKKLCEKKLQAIVE